MSPSAAEAHGVVTVGPYAALSLRYRVSTRNADLATEFDRLYRSCASSTVPDERGPIADIELHDDALLPDAMTEIDRASVDASAADFVLLHASAVLGAGGPVLLVGPSGAGKSTLSAALTTRGCTYVGDEVIGLDEAVTQIHANPKPWKLDRRSRVALVGIGADAIDDARPEGEALVAPSDLGAVHAPGPAGLPCAIVRVAFRAGADAAVVALSHADGAELLADQCFNFAQWGARALDTVAALARRTPALHLEFGDLPSAVAALESALQ